MNGESTLACVAAPAPEPSVAHWSQSVRSPSWVTWVTAWIEIPFQSTWPLVWPLCLMTVFTVVFRWTDIDITISDRFYNHSTHEWTWFFHTGCTLFYRRGTYPAFAMFGVAILLLFSGLWMRRETLYRSGLFLTLLFIIGPGLIVNYGFKNHWGRPRPHQITYFDGPMPHAVVGSPGVSQFHNSSFPSGHAAVAFYLIGPAFLASPRRRGLGTRLMMIGLGFGGAMALVRVMQGGHFMSDVVWSAAIVYFTAVGLSALILRPQFSLLPQSFLRPIKRWELESPVQ